MSKIRRINAVDFAELFVGTDAFEDYTTRCTNDSFDPNTALGLMLDHADNKGVELVNLDLFDSDEFFLNEAGVYLE